MWEKVKKVLKFVCDDYMFILCAFFMLVLSSVLTILGYYLDAICGYLAVIAINSMSSYLDSRRVHNAYEKYLKRWMEKNP